MHNFDGNSSSIKVCIPDSDIGRPLSICIWYHDGKKRIWVNGEEKPEDYFDKKVDD